jgi:2-haloacid dehalogenase
MNIRAVLFDAYGTLFDVHSVVQLCDTIHPGKGSALSQLWRQKQLEYTWLRTLMRRYEPFEAVTRNALQVAAATLGTPCTEADTERLMGEYDRLGRFPETQGALAGFGQRTLAILSNGSPRMLDAVVRHNGLAATFAAVISVDALHRFKPDRSVYDHALDVLHVARHETALVSSNYWDASGAAAAGLRAIWINRSGAIPDALGQRIDAEVRTLGDVPRVLDAM